MSQEDVDVSTANFTTADIVSALNLRRILMMSGDGLETRSRLPVSLERTFSFE